MESRFVDCSGLSCPEPVIRARKALQEPGIDEVQVKVNSTVARDNVSRSARSMGWNAEVSEVEDHFLITLTRSPGEE